jgi:hypothetical protein
MMIRTALAFVAVAAGVARRAGIRPGHPGRVVGRHPAETAVLTYAPEANGPRYLIVACLRDSDEIGIYSAGIATPSGKPVVALGMNNAGRKYTVRGEIGMDNITNQPAFRYETNIDGRALSIFRSEFIPMLGGKGPLTLTIGDKSQQVPLAGVGEPLKKFSTTCFGKS